MTMRGATLRWLEQSGISQRMRMNYVCFIVIGMHGSDAAVSCDLRGAIQVNRASLNTSLSNCFLRIYGWSMLSGDFYQDVVSTVLASSIN